ncbi:MAG: ribonuclease P protein component [Lactobacillus sp.]|nr:ribonuclease P protein component [Lactobacillus sp.]
MRKSYRVKSEKEFQRVFENGESMANRAFVIHKLPNDKIAHFRVGISVGKKVGHTAVVRNRLKRYIRQTLTEYKTQIDPKYDFVVITRPYARDFDMKTVRENLVHVLKKSELISSDIEKNEENNNDESNVEE